MKDQSVWVLAALASFSVALNGVLINEWSSKAPESEDYVEFCMVHFDGPSQSRTFPYRIRRIPASAAPLHRQAAFVMEHYGLTHRLEDGVLLVRREVWEDKGWLAIVTERASDAQWLVEHGYEVPISWTTVRRSETEDIEKRVEVYWNAVAAGRSLPDRRSRAAGGSRGR